MSDVVSSNSAEDSADFTPAATGAPGTVAAELVVHGLLEFLSRADQVERERRIIHVLDAIAAESTASPAARKHAFSLRRFYRWIPALAAMLAIVAAVFIIAYPSQHVALAAVQSTLTAMRSPGDRRFEVRVYDWTDREVHADPDIFDSRSPGGLLLIQHHPPQYGPTTVGRDEQGKWAIKPDGSVERNRPERYWPPFASVSGESLIADSVDALLESLPKRYTLKTLEAAPIDGHGTTLYQRISAVRIQKGGPTPHRVELWIDLSTRVAERIELRWDAPSDAATSRTPLPADSPGRDDHHQPPDDRSAPGDDPPPTPDGDNRPHPHPDDHPDDHHGHPGESPDDDHGPPGEHRGGHHDHNDDEPGHGPPGDEKPDSPGKGRHRPDGDGHGRSGPGFPKLILFERVDVPSLPADWFTPEGHAPK